MKAVWRKAEGGGPWTAILAFSILGLFAPERHAPVLLMNRKLRGFYVDAVLASAVFT
jgi:hypothetical protein